MHFPRNQQACTTTINLCLQGFSEDEEKAEEEASREVEKLRAERNKQVGSCHCWRGTAVEIAISNVMEKYHLQTQFSEIDQAQAKEVEQLDAELEGLERGLPSNTLEEGQILFFYKPKWVMPPSLHFCLAPDNN